MDALKFADFLPEIICEILLKLPSKSLLKFKCVSKSWNELISSPQFVKTHIELSANHKEFSHHRVVFPVSEENFKVCCLPSLFYEEQITEVFDLQNPHICSWTVGSANGLIMLNKEKEIFLWNPSIRKSKKLPELGIQLKANCFCYRRFGFAYDEFHDDYKVVCVLYICYDGASSYETLVKLYSLRTDSWKTIDMFGGDFLINVSGKFANGKIYWASSGNVGEYDVCNIVSLDLTDETWGKMELPSCGEGKFSLMLGVAGSDLSVLCTCRERGSSDVWIMKDCGVNVSWTKMFTIRYPKGVWKRIFATPVCSFSVHFRQSDKSEILLLLPKIIMIYNPKDGSTRQLDVIGYDKCPDTETNVESLVDPQLIAERGRRNHETSLSFC